MAGEAWICRVGHRGRSQRGDGKMKVQMILSLVGHCRAFCSGKMQRH